MKETTSSRKIGGGKASPNMCFILLQKKLVTLRCKKIDGCILEIDVRIWYYTVKEGDGLPV